ncbi:hypothetical protein FIU87_05400 [Bacillus sp. THAF10]|uniref:hypothetical protein n=1 Tax=Bacillus sp. THAF10 TaxID=2587848 RepID=UPI0012697FDA|nr:hypothetical protein [Bacillus sp. THAF10]QFT88069.1 hypothetical protein FIU87_05400 [Bacillus sp. THAF10]
MKLIEEMVQELTEYSTEYNKRELCKEELNLKIQLIIKRIEYVQIDYSHSPFIYLPSEVLKVFSNLLARYKSKAVDSLKQLLKADNKASYNKKARYLVQRKLYFLSFDSTIQRNVQAWAFKNNSKYPTLRDYLIVNKLLEMEGAVHE